MQKKATKFLCNLFGVLTNFSCLAHSLWFRWSTYKIPNNNIFYVYLIHFFSLSLLYSYTGTCNSPLGMESGAIADFQITASSAHDPGNVGPQHARYGFFKIIYCTFFGCRFNFQPASFIFHCPASNPLFLLTSSFPLPFMLITSLAYPLPPLFSYALRQYLMKATQQCQSTVLLNLQKCTLHNFEPKNHSAPTKTTTTTITIPTNLALKTSRIK